MAAHSEIEIWLGRRGIPTAGSGTANASLDASTVVLSGKDLRDMLDMAHANGYEVAIGGGKVTIRPRNTSL